MLCLPRHDSGVGQVPSQERRKENQVYVFFLMESPLNDGLNYTNKRLLDLSANKTIIKQFYLPQVSQFLQLDHDLQDGLRHSQALRLDLREDKSHILSTRGNSLAGATAPSSRGEEDTNSSQIQNGGLDRLQL